MTGTYDSSGATTENARFDGLARDGSDLSLRTTANVRLTSRHAALPAIIAGFSATWTQGPMILGAAWAGRFIGTLGTTPAAARSGEPEPQGDGRYGWSLYDAGPELKLAWTLGRFRPYVGAGFDLVYGRLDSLGAEERPGSEDPRGQGRLSDDRSPLESMNPTRFLVRPHAGVDIAFGRSSLGLQADYAMLSTGGGSRPPRETGPGVLIVTAAFRGTF
ncbi:MAG: hypothetical protein R3F39_18075 [Myxococcota bacterium]